MTARRFFDALTFVIAAPILLLLVCALDASTRIARRVFGEGAFYRTIAWSGRVSEVALKASFRVRIAVEGELPECARTGPFLLVANHQPPLDMLLIGILLRERAPAFVSRAGLGKWVPWVSHYLRATRSVELHGRQAVKNLASLRALGARLESSGRGAAIFPEGVTRWGEARARKPFYRAGLKVLLRSASSAPVVPMVFEGANEFLRDGTLVPRSGVTIRVRFLRPIFRAARDIDAVVDECERAIHDALASSSPIAVATPVAPSRASLEEHVFPSSVQRVAVADGGGEWM